MAASGRTGPSDTGALQSPAAGHCFRRVTLTKPTFCHSCGDFIWGLGGFLCGACNFMCHEKCLRTLCSDCSCVAPTQVQVPVAHCFIPSNQKKRFCSVCRKPLEGTTALHCEVCELHVHADCSIFSCADCRRCHLDVTVEQDASLHHWREGNLPPASRCEVCRRSCSSSDVLAGIRCEWCGVTSHTACRLSVPPTCSPGRLSSMLLPPTCVRLHSRNFSRMHIYRITESCSHDLDPSDAVDVSAVAVKDGQPAAADSSRQLLKVFDGDDAVRRGLSRQVSVTRATRSEEVLEAALRAFYLPDNPHDYELHEVGGPHCLCVDDTLNRNEGEDSWSFLRDGGDAWLLRARPRAAEGVRVHLGWPRSGAASVLVSVSQDSTAASVLADVQQQLDTQDDHVSGFDLLEVFMGGKQVQRQTLTPHEKVLDRLQDLRKVSLRQMNQTRFYVVRRRERPVQVGLLIGGLPPLLGREQYAQLIHQHLTTKSHLVTISSIYTSQGAVALRSSCFSEAERVYMLARDTTVCSTDLTALVIPDVMHHKLPENLCPLLVFVNPKSGGLKGRELLRGFRKLLNPHQVFDVSNGGPLAGLHTFRDVPRFRVLVCGGDGTVGWVLGVLEAVRHKLVCKEPPIGLVPLGTGNDLARVLCWGAGYGSEDPAHILTCVDEAEEVLMDRWTILLDAQAISEDGRDDSFLEPPKIVQMNNYFGLGIDAELSLDFHQAREDQPDKFTSRIHNKSVYVKVGLQKISSTWSLHKELQLQVDAQNVPLPSIEGLIFLNIPSWGSGADLWGSEVDCRYRKPRIDDGLLEVVGVTGVVHMGQVQSGLRAGIRIAQGNYIRLTVSTALPVQVDGEPWIQPPGHIIISAAGPKVRMLRKCKQKQKKSSAGVKDGRAESR